MSGFNEDFLEGIHLPLPVFSPSIEEELVKGKPSLREGMIADYMHYSLVMNGSPEKRSPVFVACNIDQQLFRKTSRSDAWRIDTRVGSDCQLDNAYYTDNPWDRGHIAQRDSSGWGNTTQAAQRGANETFFYTNCCLQHENFNQDEWLALEDWIHDLDLDADGKISVFAGPVYGEYDRTIKPGGKSLARIPCAFWKIVCFKNKTSGNLDVRAFIMYQDEAALRDKNGRTVFNNQIYQSTVLEIERLTGIEFDDTVYDANPLFYHAENAPPELNVSRTPELIEVSTPEDIISADTKRQTVNDDIVDIFIAMAGIRSDVADGIAWISLINLGSTPVDLVDWQLRDKRNTAVLLTGDTINGSTVVKPGESRTIRIDAPFELGADGGVIKLYDDGNNRIDWVNFTAAMVTDGKPVLFLAPRETLNT
jgi:endonuclease G